MALKLRRRTRTFTNESLQHRSCRWHRSSLRTGAASFKRVLGSTDDMKPRVPTLELRYDKLCLCLVEPCTAADCARPIIEDNRPSAYSPKLARAVNVRFWALPVKQLGEAQIPDTPRHRRQSQILHRAEIICSRSSQPQQRTPVRQHIVPDFNDLATEECPEKYGDSEQPT